MLILGDIAATAYVVAVLVQITKFAVNAALSLKSTDPNQNNVIRLYVFVVALVICGGDAALSTPAFSRALALSVVEQAFSVAISAIIGWHLLTDNGIPTPAAVTPAEPVTIPSSDPPAALPPA